ncbi:DUF86 domain-containing protein [Variovorax sp. CAN2819]|uniref:HepT-like ribonuclease domain-containing protein n=1 Tax=Variovorax sp. CAN15 TaxID=3046727 RepID=UPI0026478085|nr:DUF86 domain-containing protein [Variovorax sp. CAN15]MDN6887740.1 DUF86 domain-containing protein [Variovorax sp. CAN15]
MSRRDPQRVADYLGHILQAIDSIREYTSDATADSYLADRKTQDAVVRNLEVIGEASNNIVKHHAEFALAHPAVPWRFAYEMRNALSHGYFTIDHTLVWRTIQHDLPSLREQVVRLLET